MATGAGKVFRFLGNGWQYLCLYALLEDLPLEQTALLCTQGQLFVCNPISGSPKGSLLDYRDFLWKKDSLETNSAHGRGRHAS